MQATRVDLANCVVSHGKLAQLKELFRTYSVSLLGGLK